MVSGFYQTSSVFPIPEPWRGDRKHTEMDNQRTESTDRWMHHFGGK